MGPDSMIGVGAARLMLRWGVFVLLFAVLDRLSFVHHFNGLPITPWSPNTGLAFAFLLHYGPINWLVVAVAAIVSEHLIHGTNLAAAYPSALAYALTYAVAAAAFRRIRGLSLLLEQPRDVALFLAVAGVAVVTASFLRMAFVTGAAEGWFGAIYSRLWVGDMTGIAIFTPLFLHLLIRGRRYLVHTTGERLLQLTLAIAVTFIVFGLESTNEFKFFYLLFPPVMWIALRGGFFQTVGMLALIQCGIILATSSRGLPDEMAVEFQVLMLTLGITGLFMSATAGTRQRAEVATRDRLVELSRLTRIQATNEVAAGLAHELKQPMFAVLNFIGAARRLLEREPPDLAEAVAHIRSAEAQVLRADETLKRIRAFVQKGETNPVPVSLAKTVAEAVRMLGPMARRENVRIEVAVSAGLPLVMADEIQLLQILVNLLTNAVQAVAEADAPIRVVVVTAATTPGWEVRLTVTDSGPGLSDAVIDELFQPFVTGRTQGIGIGLSISRAMAEAQGGLLWHDPPVPGRGATFHLTLPVLKVDR